MLITHFFYREINNIIMNYLVNQGYAGSAQKFAQELNLADPTGPDGMDQRVRVRDLIHMGKIDEAIELINEFDPAVSFLSFLSPHDLEKIIHQFMHHS